MIELPHSLEKYKKFFESCPLIDRISPVRLSDRLLEHINTSRDGKLLLLLSKNFKETEYFIPKLEDIPSCFMEKVWRNCTIEDKIKLADKYLDYFFQNCPQIRPTLLLLPKTKQSTNKSTLGYYAPHSKRLFINLDKLSTKSGIEFLSVLYHECTHVKDFSRIEKEIMPRLLKEYTDTSSDILKYPLLCDEYVMRMSASGMAINKKTGEKKYIDGKLKNDILRAKNYYSIFECSTIYDPSDVKSKDDFRQYLQTILYYYSPIERFARISVKQFFKEQLKNKDFISEADESYLISQVESEKNVDQMLNDFKELLVVDGKTIIDMKDLLDLAMQNNFYQKPSFVGQSNAIKFPQEAERVKVTYERIVDNIYFNLLMKAFVDPVKFGNPHRKIGPSLEDERGM